MAGGGGATPAGYSGTPLVRKLGIKQGHRVLFVDAPQGYADVLGALPHDVQVMRVARSPIDLIQFFVRDRRRLESRLPELKRLIKMDGMLWVSWPKKSSGVATDVDGNVVREVGLGSGLVDVKVAAVDEVWSGLKFVYRTADRGSRLRR